MAASTETTTFLVQMGAVLIGARMGGEIASRLKTPAVMGELAAGILLGPSLLGWIDPGETLRIVAGLGIILLLFEVGLETDLGKLFNAGRKSALAALAGMVAPMLFGYGISRWGFGLEPLVCLFIGGSLTATSIGITVRVLADLKRQQSPEAQIVLGAAVIDDVLGVILLALLYDFSKSGAVEWKAAGRTTLFILGFMVVAPFLAKLVAGVFKRIDARSKVPGAIPSLMMALLLFFAWAAHGIGAPEILGGFVVGLALSREFSVSLHSSLRADHDFAHRVEEQMKPLTQTLAPVFFVMVGLSLNLRTIDWGSATIWGLSGSLLLAAVAGKMLCGLVLPATPWKERLAVGLAMIPRGEVGLIFAELGRSSGIFDPTVYAAMVLVIALTTLVPPFLLRALYGYDTSLSHAAAVAGAAGKE